MTKVCTVCHCFPSAVWPGAQGDSVSDILLDPQRSVYLPSCHHGSHWAYVGDTEEDWKQRLSKNQLQLLHTAKEVSKQLAFVILETILLSCNIITVFHCRNSIDSYLIWCSSSHSTSTQISCNFHHSKHWQILNLVDHTRMVTIPVSDFCTSR